MYTTLFTTALIAATAQAENILKLGRNLEADQLIEEGRMLAAEMDKYEERMLEATENDGRRQLYHYDNDTSKTFNNGRNRKSGMYYRNGNYQLASSIIVARSGERDAGFNGYDVSDTDFTTTDKSLTEQGAKTMNAVGAAIKKSWTYGNDTLKHWVDTSTYKSSEVYAYAGSTDRMNDSTIALLDGLYGKSPTAFPIATELAASTDYPQSAQPAAADDLLMVASPADSCPRIGLIDAEIAANAGVITLKEKITKFLEEKYFPRLKALLGDDSLTSDQLKEVAQVIEWAQQNALPLKIGATDSALSSTELNYNKVAVDADNYAEFALTKDQWYPQS